MKYTQLLLRLMDNDAPESSKLTLEFLVTYSKLENALLRAGLFIKASTIPRVDWKEYTKLIQNKFKINEVKKAYQYILEKPPRRLRNKDGKLEWERKSFNNGESDLEKVISYVADIRNNLFHGGKYNGAYEPDYSRNYNLLTNALELLNYWIGLDTNIEEKYCERFY